MKNILVVFTGGTIGSIATGGTINTSDTTSFKLIQLFEQHYENHRQIHFDTIQPLQILSENLAPTAWKTLIAAIEAAQPDQYDGIIITHGTDTLAYTACALSFYFNAAKIPMLLVSSDYPLDHPKANGLDNFICAVEFILQKNQPGVFVPYRNQQQATQLHQGTRLACSLQLSGDFFSVQGKSYLQFANRQFSLVNPPAQQMPTQNTLLKADFSERLLMVKPYPGLDYSRFNLDGVDAVLHDLYHSGTACASAQWGENYSLLEFIRRCEKQGVTVYLAPAIKSADAYQSTQALIEQGAKIIWNMSIEAAYVKLLLAYGNFDDQQEIMDFIVRDLAGEHL
ncbi:MAG: asparaginase domain-containing protein [Methylobacter sp.]|uniref:asparaginase n=1 Tax=Methylobacter sp. TaxID=2051955 RepID=UPI0025CC6925|nr:asparaginase domain-containing protein [Methylobacter sp.]MCK9619588.1 asparaginase domain-containing protein [Methylobacter sp.]